MSRADAGAASARRAVIGVDARSLAWQPTGVGRYVANLVRAAASLDDQIRFRMLTPGPLPKAMSSLPGRAMGRDEQVETEMIPMPGPAALARLDNVFTWTHMRLPWHLTRRPVDLLHAPFYTLPVLCPAPAVVTIHDVTFHHHPEWFTWHARLAFSGFAASSARKARHVLTVSECSRRDIIAAWGIAPSQVTAVPLAPDPSFVRVTDPIALARVRAAHELPARYLIHVGSISPRRNIARLLDAFAEARSAAPDLALLLAGRVEPPSPPLAPEVARRGLEKVVRIAGYLPERDLPALYSGALAVVYPSLYEGFGLPVLEAMACGAPVLASDNSCFPEVAGTAALLVDPTRTEAIARGIVELASNTALRARLITEGRERARVFSWERTARGTLAVYRKALARPEAEP